MKTRGICFVCGEPRQRSGAPKTMQTKPWIARVVVDGCELHAHEACADRYEQFQRETQLTARAVTDEYGNPI